jgi:hypothetical protein
MIPPRLSDWRERLTAYLVSVAGRPFAYGSHDCALFVAGAVEAMTDFDPAALHRGQYDSLVDGLWHLRTASGSELVDPWADDDEGTPSWREKPELRTAHIDLLDFYLDEVPPALAQVGDIAVLAEVDGIAALGIFAGDVIAVLRPDGLGHVSRMDAVAAYRVP